jgi:hypothetical protein
MTIDMGQPLGRQIHRAPNGFLEGPETLKTILGRLKERETAPNQKGQLSFLGSAPYGVPQITPNQIRDPPFTPSPRVPSALRGAWRGAL